MQFIYFKHNIRTNCLSLPTKFPKFYALRYVCACVCVCVCVWERQADKKTKKKKKLGEDHKGVWNRQYPHFKISRRKLRKSQRPTWNTTQYISHDENQQENENTHFEIAENVESHQSQTAITKGLSGSWMKIREHTQALTMCRERSDEECQKKMYGIV